MKDTLIAGLLFAGLVGGLLGWLGAIDYTVPDVRNAATLGHKIAAFLGGLVILAAALALIVLGAVRFNAIPLASGAVLVLLGLPLLGVTVGVPRGLASLADLLQALIDLLNALLRVVARMVD